MDTKALLQNRSDHLIEAEYTTAHLTDREAKRERPDRLTKSCLNRARNDAVTVDALEDYEQSTAFQNQQTVEQVAWGGFGYIQEGQRQEYEKNYKNREEKDHFFDPFSLNSFHVHQEEGTECGMRPVMNGAFFNGLPQKNHTKFDK